MATAGPTEKTISLESTETIEDTPMAELASYHQEIEEKYKGVHPDKISINPNTSALMAFNGYYSMTIINGMPQANGAFFTIDTNMHIQEGSNTPNFDLALMISMDGTSSVRVPFTGKFHGNHLTQGSSKESTYDIDLTFVRSDKKNDGSVATFSGKIRNLKIPQVTVQVQGTTYNNPVHYPVFEGDYISNDSIPVLHIDKDYNIHYDYGSGTGILRKVPSYTFNLNMYFFSFSTNIEFGLTSIKIPFIFHTKYPENSIKVNELTKGREYTKFIMGTAAAQGLACNNIIVISSIDKKIVTNKARSLRTIQHPKQEPLVFPNLKSKDLAVFSGYYQLPSVSKKAFISVQAEYVTLIGSIDAYVVMIGISMDGKTSTGYYFNEKDMSFENDTLIMKNQKIKLTFKREYKLQQGSLVSISGSINGASVNGYTPFNPVPLSVFGGVTMRNAKKSELTVVNDNKVKFNDTEMDNILYVPIMYILAYPPTTTTPTTVMSFGTDGLKGNACIVAEREYKNEKIVKEQISTFRAIV